MARHVLACHEMIGNTEPVTRPTILVVDDENGPREAFRLVLEDHFNVLTAESGSAALDVLRENRVDVVTLDLMMPFLSGIETLKRIRELDPEVEEAARSLGASSVTSFRRVVFPNIFPGVLSGMALALAKAIGEFGALVIITGNLPFRTEVSSVYIFGRIEGGDTAAAASVAVVLLALSFVLLLSIGAIRHFTTRHDRA